MNSYLLSFVPLRNIFYLRNVCFHMKIAMNIMWDLRFSQRSHPRFSYTFEYIYIYMIQGSRVRFPGTTKKVMGLERGPLSLVSTNEELLDRKVAAPV
jgi:hypothetical protein